ncbi:MAG: ribonuclease P protein subunit [Candidatus Diapherotrites archaeon]
MIKGKHYEITQKNLPAHELIGLNAKVVKSVDSKKTGVKGKVVNETKNILELENNSVIKKIPKKEVVFEFEIGNEKIIIDGKMLNEKPENRVKEFWRKYHGKLQ